MGRYTAGLGCVEELDLKCEFQDFGISAGWGYHESGSAYGGMLQVFSL